MGGIAWASATRIGMLSELEGRKEWPHGHEAISCLHLETYDCVVLLCKVVLMFTPIGHCKVVQPGYLLGDFVCHF